MNRLVVVGAGGHAKVIADIAVKTGYSHISFLDDHAVGSCMGFPIVGTTADLEGMDDGATDFVIGIGNNTVRQAIAKKYDVHWIPLIHPAAKIAIHVTIGRGTVVMAGAVINSCAEIGEHCIINTGAIVEHDNIIEDYVHLSPGVVLGGTVRIGELTHVGLGAVVRNNIHIGDACTIGAGAVVVKNIDCSGVYVGIPARKIK